MNAKAQKRPKTTFRSVFAPEVEGHRSEARIRWRIRGSGVRGEPDEAETTQLVLRALVSAGIPVRRFQLESPANPVSYHLEAKFEDGGLEASTGPYFFGDRGAWIVGDAAVLMVASLLKLTCLPDLRSGEYQARAIAKAAIQHASNRARSL